MKYRVHAEKYPAGSRSHCFEFSTEAQHSQSCTDNKIEYRESDVGGVRIFEEVIL